jgi:hypothetical protein
MKSSVEHTGCPFYHATLSSVSSRLQRLFMLSHSLLFNSQKIAPAVDFTAQPSLPQPYAPQARYDCSLGTYPATSSVLETMVDHDSQASKQAAIFIVSSICAVWSFDQPIIFVAHHYFVAYLLCFVMQVPLVVLNWPSWGSCCARL